MAVSAHASRTRRPPLGRYASVRLYLGWLGGSQVRKLPVASIALTRKDVEAVISGDHPVRHRHLIQRVINPLDILL